MSIQGFLIDKALISDSQFLVNTELLTITCGRLDRETKEYFTQPLELTDLRANRLDIEYRSEALASVDLEAMLASTETELVNVGLVHLSSNPDDTVTVAQYTQLNPDEFTNDVLPTDAAHVSSNRKMIVTIDATKLVGDDYTALHSISANEKTNLYNIIEYMTYGTVSTDSVADIDSFLIGNSDFQGYVSSSVVINPRHDVVFLHGGINIHRYAPVSFAFRFIIGTYTVSISLWFNTSEFAMNYPLSTIIDVVPPLPLATLINPVNLSDPISSAILSKFGVDYHIDPDMDTVNQSGMSVFRTRYIWQGKTYQVTFSVTYRGRTPNSMELREAVVAYLTNSGVGTVALWEVLLPDVFYKSSFVLIPFYDNVTVLTNADVYPSIINMTPLVGKIDQILSHIERATDPYREIMTAAYAKYFIGVAPADVNESSSLLTLHPTYQDASTTDAGFSEMTSNDREWSVKLNQALSIADGGENILTFSTLTLGNGTWINFVYNSANYLVLTHESYNTIFDVT